MLLVVMDTGARATTARLHRVFAIGFDHLRLDAFAREATVVDEAYA